MTDMAVAARAANFHTSHSKAFIQMLIDCLFGDGLEKTRPAGSGFIFGATFKQRLIAGNAMKQPGSFFIKPWPCKGAFGAMLARDFELLRGQTRPPLVFGECPGRGRLCSFFVCHHTGLFDQKISDGVQFGQHLRGMQGLLIKAYGSAFAQDTPMANFCAQSLQQSQMPVEIIMARRGTGAAPLTP